MFLLVRDNVAEKHNDSQLVPLVSATLKENGCPHVFILDFTCGGGLHSCL